MSETAAALRALTLSLTLLPLCATAQDEVPAPQQAPRPAKFVVGVGEHALSDVIQQAARFLGRNILVDENELAQAPSSTIRVTERIEADPLGCWEVIGSLLYSKGFGIVPLDEPRDIYEVVFLGGARARSYAGSARFVPENELEAYANLRATAVLTTVSLDHINANVATNALRPFFAQAGAGAIGALTFGTAGNNTSLLIQGSGAQVYAASKLLRLVDVPAMAVDDTVSVVILKHADARDVAQNLERVFSSPTPQQLQGVQTFMPLVAVPYMPQNAIVLKAQSSQWKSVLALVDQLDKPGREPAPTPPSVEKRLAELEAQIKKLQQQLAERKDSPK